MGILGFKHSEESKKKMSESHKGNTNFLGHKHSIKTKQKISKAKSKPIKFIIDSKGCYICTSHHKDSSGYPNIRVNRRMRIMSRYLYTLKYGEIPNGMCVCHTCDNPACINIKHFFLGTHKQNMDDKRAKKRGRSLLGEKNKSSKLTEEQVKQIRDRKFYPGITNDLSKEYHIGTSTVCAIRLRQTWKHVI